MKNFKTFESFIAKEINENFVEIPNLSDVDHTRVVKWMYQNIDNDYSIKKMGKGHRIDVHKLSKNEFDDLIGYLQSQDYLQESLNESEDATPYLDEVKAALPDLEDLIKKELGFKPKLDVKASRGRLEITSGDIINELGKTLVKTMFVEVTIGFWGGNITKDGKTIWFNPKLWYKHPSGGTNGTDFVWDSLWYDLEKKEWITGRSFV